ncbi:MAG: CopG family transcriptional regulator [Elusimicrobia bacterium CG03_land_8_20_14_0_80_50_18]|nr:MAG: CopG family transcriptional regulator [Elusimicrobia bacterium CG03_land_8_20_14_0_80_50_18]PIX14216.1 MAG: CopG family transcriptional regulator [Elusimicrobia bacterium CG_4_8_14_3_um_filter_50_9]
MSSAKIAISMEWGTVESLDRLVREHVFINRSRAIQEAVQEKLERIEHGRLSRECAKLDPAFEKAMAEEGLSEETKEWPKY